MLKYRNEFRKSIEKTISDREDFINILKSQNWVINVYESEADFVLVETNPKILKLVNLLLSEKSIYIRDISNKFNDNKTYFRFAVRTLKENNLVISTINTYLKKYV